MDQYLIVRVQATSGRFRQLQYQRAYSPQTALTATLIASLGYPVTTLSLDTSLEGLTECTESSCFMVRVHYSERIQRSIGQGMKHKALSLGKQQSWSFHHPLPMKTGGTTFLAFATLHTECCQQGKITWDSVFGVFIGDQ